MNKRIGILGGGQLAMYLCADARRLGMTTRVIAHSDDAPAANTADFITYAALDDRDTLDALIADVDVVTFDVEEVPPSTLEYLESRAADGDVAVHPATSAMLMLQDKLLQKQWMVRNGLPTLPFVEFDSQAGASDPQAAAAAVGIPLVQKARRGGYDGRGVQVLRDSADLDQLWPVPSLLEPFLVETRELSVLAARSENGEIVCYEPVELTFNAELNVLDGVISPAPISKRQSTLAQSIARRALTRLEGAGLYALELFLTPDGDLVINEISPRVHNSGHHTMESCETSQFEQHLRAIGGLPLGSTRQIRPSFMCNLLCPEDAREVCIDQAVRTSNIRGDTFVHWYGKRKVSPGRKMGHVTALADTTEEAAERAHQALETACRMMVHTS